MDYKSTEVINLQNITTSLASKINTHFRLLRQLANSILLVPFPK